VCVLTAPPPNERSQFPMSVLATIRGMVSGCDQPTASIAMATCARGILSSRTRIWKGHGLSALRPPRDRQRHRPPLISPVAMETLAGCGHYLTSCEAAGRKCRGVASVSGRKFSKVVLRQTDELVVGDSWRGSVYRSSSPCIASVTPHNSDQFTVGSYGRTSGGGQDHPWSEVVSGDVLHEVGSVDAPERETFTSIFHTPAN